MTPVRVTGPGPRTVTLRATAADLHRVASLVLVAILVAACGSTTPTSSPAASGGVPSTAPIASAPSGSASPAPVADGSAGPDASQPRWRGSAVEAILALGAADDEIRKAGADLQQAADAQDLKAMWGAADGLAKMIDGLMPNIDRLSGEPATMGVEPLYKKAFPELGAGAKQLRDSITSGDSSGVVAGSQAIAQGLNDYAPIRDQIGDLIEQAIFQQRLLTQ